MSRSSRPTRPPVGGLRVEGLWKRYRRTSTRPLLRDQVSRGKDGAEWMWVLRDVGFTVEPGDSLALVGLNGSGKSTLLKILTGSTEPYAGRIATSGRIGALIEIRAGIHPDLTGRENIYLNGTVLGLSRREVHSRLDEIVAFAELDDAVDRQVKFYSSGMGMRLGFSVAAFLEPSILMVDEALAVGDVAFQQRCLDRMRYVQDQGTTLLFVSHDMSAVEAMCRRSIWLDGGIVQADGLTGDVLSSYRIGLEEKARELSESSTDPVRVLAAVVEGGPDESGPRTNGEMTIRLTMRSDETREVQLSLGLSEGPAAPIFVVSRRVEVPAGQSRVACQLTDVPLPRGRYYLWAGASDTRSRSVLSWRPVAPVDIEGPARPRVPAGVMVQSPVHVETTWIGEPAPLPVLPPPPPVPPVLPDLELTQGH